MKRRIWYSILTFVILLRGSCVAYSQNLHWLALTTSFRIWNKWFWASTPCRWSALNWRDMSLCIWEIPALVSLASVLFNRSILSWNLCLRAVKARVSLSRAGLSELRPTESWTRFPRIWLTSIASPERNQLHIALSVNHLMMPSTIDSRIRYSSIARSLSASSS